MNSFVPLPKRDRFKSMKVYKGIKLLVKEIDRLKKKGKRIGFVPTMGFLHEGHLSLIRKAKKDTDAVVISIFVNPAQFGPQEDFKKYPRDLKRDLALCKKEGVDIIFAPETREMYPEGYCTYVNVENITDTMCGRSRPGHFRGVATVVMKLFNIVKPDIAYFGQKDAQQLTVIKQMVKDLNMSVKIQPMPIVRERDGLAMSSRNAYLNPRERVRALWLYKSLRLAKKLFNAGERDTQKIIQKMREFIAQKSKGEIDYISIVEPESLENVQKISKRAMAALAVKIGNTRLIDNIMLTK